ncbi:ABC transporter permease [Octadecabacter ascidiaceicola]|uniref:Polysialic acid transport protein KpsM n=1 Tax=Octadecabacter ascidiaceicola TaxID=1655543 RepID=A0A238JPX1_9RHOB|nr:Polysialic acid transport protein KpsM [Octadecabacter ascidiaceicola]
MGFAIRPATALNRPTKLRRLHAPFATPRAIVALILREISTTYGRSPGGYLWAILEPAAGIALLTVIFSIGFRAPPLGVDFAFFYATGLLAFLMYSDISAKLGQTIQFSRALLEYPRVTFIDALVARLALNALTQLIVHCIVMGFILWFSSPDTAIDFPKLLTAYGMIIVLSAGVGTLNSFLTLSFPIWATAWAVLNRPLFLASCLFFLFEVVPQPYRDILWYNPLVHIVGMMRDGYYPYYQPTYVSVAYPIALGLGLLVIGLFLLNRYHRDILQR